MINVNIFKYIAEVFDYYELKAEITDFKNSDEQYLLVYRKNSKIRMLGHRLGSDNHVREPFELLESLSICLSDWKIGDLKTKRIKRKIKDSETLLDYLVNL